ncbi:E3 ubiquitin-protein ligase TRAIP [Lucilia sericata]|uniref:E3 ubiquitin-protein ligase TRAIP n=1 Tax=Lucilia sericata TaxID=13632 RepID=UPI0018A805B8|nr:E3 ubiquitin-protein ligase TRAIP [Lucilia sericata]
MLNLNCVICAELFNASDDVHVTSCGHMFHIACLSQWLQRSKTCPQCRNKCTDRNIIRVYFNLANLDVSRIDVGSLQEQLDNVQLQLKVKEKDLQKSADQIKDSKETQKKCMKTIAGLEKDLQSKSFLILNYAEKTKMLESQVKAMENLRKENKNLKLQIDAMEGINTLLTSTMSDAEKMLQNESDPKILSVWVATLKRELRVCETKKADMRNVLKVVQNDLRKEIDQRKKQEERISQLESENYQLLEKIKGLEATIKKSNNNNNNNYDAEKSLNGSIGLNTACNDSLEIMSPPVAKIKEEKRLTISPTIKDNIKKIEESSSPYLNIKSCSVLLPPLLMKNHENRISNNTKPMGNKLTVLKISPTKPALGAIRKTRSDLSQKYSILKKPRLDLAASSGSSGSTMKPLAPNFVFNGFGGSERVDPFESKLNSDDDCQVVSETKEQTEVKPTKPAPTSSIHSRLKSGGLRNFKLTK